MWDEVRNVISEIKLIKHRAILSNMTVELVINRRIKEQQDKDPELVKIKEKLDEKPAFEIIEGILTFKGRL